MSDENKSESSPLDYCSVMQKIEGSYKGSVDDLNVLVDDAFAETVKRVLSTGKAGKLTVVLAVSRKNETQLYITGDVKTSLPNPKPDSRTFYHDNRGNLFADDPRQMKLPNVTPLKRVGGTND